MTEPISDDLKTMAPYIHWLEQERATIAEKLAAAEAVVEAARNVDTACDLVNQGTRGWCIAHHEWCPCPFYDLADALATYTKTEPTDG